MKNPTQEKTLHSCLKTSVASDAYLTPLWNILCLCFPEDDLFADFSDSKLQTFFLRRFEEALPFFRLKTDREKGVAILQILTQKRFDSRNFIHDMISRWLLPGRKVDIELFFSGDFTLFDHLYIGYEIVIRPRNRADLDHTNVHLFSLENEMKLGFKSIYHARKVLEAKGFTLDEKTALIQERIAHLIAKKPKFLDYDLFSEMQHFLVTSTMSFRKSRSLLLMIRVIVIRYLFRRHLLQSYDHSPSQRHILIKTVPSQIQLPLGTKPVLGVVIGLNLLREHEVFKCSHLEKALSSLNATYRVVDDSYLETTHKDPRIHLYYIEIEKSDGEKISLSQHKEIEVFLHEHIETHIERLVHPLFMPRNEEEVLKNAVLMSRQLVFSKDIPQIMISFDEQTEQEISFTVILARVLRNNEGALEDALSFYRFPFAISIEKRKIMGKIRNKYPKEVVIFQVKMPFVSFMREDNSLDLFDARQSLFSELENAFGELRDFNGGLLGKQREALEKMRKCLAGMNRQNDYLLETFFHSLHPAEMRIMLSMDELLIFYDKLEEVIKQKRDTGTYFFKESSGVIYFFVTDNPEFKNELSSAIEALKMPRLSLLSLRLQLYGLEFFGGYFFEEDRELQEKLIENLTFE